MIVLMMFIYVNRVSCVVGGSLEFLELFELSFKVREASFHLCA